MMESQADTSSPRTAVSGTATLVPPQTEVKGPGSRRAAIQRWLLGHPELLLALALAAFLRLWHIEFSQFLDDQTYLMQLARGAFLYGAFPVTGIPSSIGTLNLPLSIYIVMPFTLFSANPMPLVIFIALWNVAGVALAYIFTERYFGRWAAATAAFLFAACGAAVNYSRFIWQQNYLPPVLALWAITLFFGCVRGRRGWLVPNVALLVVAGQLHPTALLLTPVTIVALLLTPRSAQPSRRSYLLAAAVLVLLFVPTIIWQFVNSGSDLRMLAHYFTRGSKTNLDVFVLLFRALGTLSPSDFGPNSPFASLGSWYPLLASGTAILLVLGMVVLTVQIVRPALVVWRAHPAVAGAGRMNRLRQVGLNLWRGLRADATWRANLLLWLTVAVPVALMIRHSNELTVHYLMVLYPFAFIVAGVGVQSVVRWARDLAASPSSKGSMRNTLAQATPAIVVVVLTLMVAVQSVLWATYPASIASGQFDAFEGYGYPLSEVQQADSTLASVQREQGATSMAIIVPTDLRYREPLDYLLVSEHPGRTDFTDNCLVLPAAQASSSLLVTTQPAGLAGTLAATLPNAHIVAEVQVPGSAAWNVYAFSDATPALADEHAVTPTDFVDANGNGLRLEAISAATNGLVRLRWTVLGSADQPSGTPWYRIQPGLPAASGAGNATPLPKTDCQPTHWQAGETLFTWVSLATGASSQSLTVQVRGGTLAPRLANVGPVSILAGRVGGKGLETLPPVSGDTTSDGALILPLSVVGLP